MSRDKQTTITSRRTEARAERERRLAEALRENLKRRKDQSRGRSNDPEPLPARGDEEK